MAPKNRDARSCGDGKLLIIPSRTTASKTEVYIQTRPLPIPSHQGMHIQARSNSVYNCSSPTREAVFRENYARRRRQMTEQGYNAVNFKPYKVVGEPFHLDEGKLILHSLGQLSNEVDLDERTSSSDEDDKADKNKGAEIHKGELEGTQPKKFVLRRKSTKNKKTLSKEVADGRRMITSVKLGHGLFTIIRSQDNARRNAEEIEHRKMMEKRRREWQPAHIPSSSEGETDEELGEDVDLSSYMCSATTHRDSDHEVKEVAFSRASLLGSGGVEPMSDEETVRTGSLSPTKSVLTEISTLSAKKRKKKKKTNPPRPYTPCHSNINLHTETEEEDASRESIFRQLCALIWILQAMDLDQQKFVMRPILQCWNINYQELEENSFNLMSMRTVQRDKQMEQRWSRFLTQKDFMERQKRMGRSFGNTLTLAVASVRSTPRKSSLAGIASFLQRSPSTMSSNHSSTPIPQENLLEREDVMSRVDEDTEYERGTQKTLDFTRRDSVSIAGNERIEESQTRESFSARRQRTGSISSIRSTRDMQALALRQNKPRNASLSQKSLEGTPPRKTDRAIRTWVASTNRIRAQSAPLGGRENRFDFPSVKYYNLPIDLRHKFSDVAEDKALVLHDTLEAMEKKRLWRSEEKFKHITNEKHISTQLEKIKNAAKEPDELLKGSKKKDGDPRRRKNQDEEEVKWFQDLKSNLPAAMCEDRRISAIMDRLENIGNFESRKITPQKFLNVLSGLRSWELCSPDISAAIEFVREKVVNMAVDDFEEWCQHHMPQVLRAQSAPPR